jgi:hypothetical protein
VAILPGKTLIFATDGTILKWGGEPMHAVIHPNLDRADITAGGRHLRTVNIPTKYLTFADLVSDFLTRMGIIIIERHVANLVERMSKQQTVQRELISRKRTDWDQMMAGRISMETWILRIAFNNELLQICDELLAGFLSELEKFSPEYVQLNHTFVFTKG